jgi:hypothetical protein
MVSLAVCAAMVGAALGSRFKVLVLVPATAITALATMAVAVCAGAGAWSTLMLSLDAVISLQVGYIGGLVIDVVTTTPAADARSAH